MVEGTDATLWRGHDAAPVGRTLIRDEAAGCLVRPDQASVGVVALEGQARMNCSNPGWIRRPTAGEIRSTVQQSFRIRGSHPRRQSMSRDAPRPAEAAVGAREYRAAVHDPDHHVGPSTSERNAKVDGA